MVMQLAGYLIFFSLNNYNVWINFPNHFCNDRSSCITDVSVKYSVKFLHVNETLSYNSFLIYHYINHIPIKSVFHLQFYLMDNINISLKICQYDFRNIYVSLFCIRSRNFILLLWNFLTMARKWALHMLVRLSFRKNIRFRFFKN